MEKPLTNLDIDGNSSYPCTEKKKKMYKTIGETYGFTLNSEIWNIFHKSSKKKMDLFKAVASEI